MKYAPFIFLFIGFSWLGFKTAPALLKDHELASFKKIEGTLLDIKLSGGGSNPGGSRGFLTGEFVYYLDGVKYSSQSLVVEGGYNEDPRPLYSNLKREVNEKNQVSVYFNPNDPSEAYLSLGTDNKQYFFDIIFSGFFIVIGGWILLEPHIRYDYG